MPSRSNAATRRPAVSQQRSADTRRAILDAAARLFASKGFGATGVREIGAAAGVNAALVSYHFGNKAALYEEILGEAVDHAAALAAAVDLDAAADDAERQLVRIFANALASRPHLIPMVLREQLDPAKPVRRRAAPRLTGFMALTERVLKAIPLRPRARRYDTQLVHLICVAPLIHFLVARRVREAAASRPGSRVSNPTLDDMVETLGDMLAHALRPKS